MKVVLDVIDVKCADFFVFGNKDVTVNVGTGQLVTVIRNHFNNNVISPFDCDETKVIRNIYRSIWMVFIIDDLVSSFYGYDICLTMFKIHICGKFSIWIPVGSLIIIGGPDNGQIIADAGNNCDVVGCLRSGFKCPG